MPKYFFYHSASLMGLLQVPGMLRNRGNHEVIPVLQELAQGTVCHREESRPQPELPITKSTQPRPDHGLCHPQGASVTRLLSC